MSGCFGPEDTYLENLTLIESDYDYIVFEVIGSDVQIFNLESELLTDLKCFDGELDIEADDDSVRFEIFLPIEHFEKIRDNIDYLIKKYKLVVL